MEKPYASLIAQLSMSESVTTNHRQPTDLRCFHKHCLEQYCLSLDLYEQSKQMINDNQDDSNKMAEDSTVHLEENQLRHQSVIAALSTPVSKYNGWKPFASTTEIQLYKRGRIGNDEIKMIPFPASVAKPEIFEKCGQNHQFKGRISLKEEYLHGLFPTFIVENLQVTEGKWYFCVKLPVGGVVQIGWATKGFTPQERIGIGDDEYSWSYGGSRTALLRNGPSRRKFNITQWKENDVCGCGIDIDGSNTNIKYWLNGKLLSTAFKHQENIPRSTKKYNLLPHGRMTTFFPGVTLQFDKHRERCCEMIFSPEDMHQCPLPAGYKPLLPPKLVHTENSIVAYPFHAYLIGDNTEDYFYTSRTMPSISLLRDFVNEDHLSIQFPIEDHRLILSEKQRWFSVIH